MCPPLNLIIRILHRRETHRKCRHWWLGSVNKSDAVNEVRFLCHVVVEIDSDVKSIHVGNQLLPVTCHIPLRLLKGC